VLDFNMKMDIKMNGDCALFKSRDNKRMRILKFNRSRRGMGIIGIIMIVCAIMFLGYGVRFITGKLESLNNKNNKNKG